MQVHTELPSHACAPAACRLCLFLLFTSSVSNCVQVLYPAMRAVMGDAEPDHCLHKHQHLKELLDELSNTSITSEQGGIQADTP